MPGNTLEVPCCMVSHMEWLPVKEEAEWLKLSLFKNEVENITLQR